MKRNYLIDEPAPLNHKELVLQTAFHEAGHAAAIHLCNQQKQLPPVYFQISLYGITEITEQKKDWIATVQGGHLIQNIPVTIIAGSCHFFSHGNNDYRLAYEADIVNLLTGPLAEAKYVAQRDDEYINARLINVNSLKYYGGTYDLEKVAEYLDGLDLTHSERTAKLNELFLAAYQFIDAPAHWQAITNLAHYILQHDKNVIDYQEAIDVLDQAIMS